MPQISLERVSVAELERELARRRRRIPVLERRRAALQQRLDAIDAELAELKGEAKARRVTKVRRAKNPVPLTKLMMEILRERKSMKVGELAEELIRRGYKSSAQNFRLMVNQVLIKDKRFRSIRRGRYALSKLGLKALGQSESSA